MMGEDGRENHEGETYVLLDESLIVTDMATATADKYAHLSPPVSCPALTMLSVNKLTVTPALMLDSLIDFILLNGWNENAS